MMSHPNLDLIDQFFAAYGKHLAADQDALDAFYIALPHQPEET